MKERIYYDMCPYCENEVELYSLEMQQCPKCGLHFQPAEDAPFEDYES